MAAMAAILIWEALKFDRLLVLSLHPESIAGEDWYYPNRPLKWSDLVPRPYGGMSLRYHFADIPPDTSRQLSIGLIERLRRREDISFISVDDYLEGSGNLLVENELAKSCA
jgi:hypothetical protein